MSESCHKWVSHVTWKWVISRMNESRHTWRSHFTYKWVLSHMKEIYHIWTDQVTYGVATVSRLLKNIGLFCRISSLLQGSFAKETYDFKEHTNRSHPIVVEGVEDTYEYEWDTSHMKESFHTWMSRVAYERDTSHIDRTGHTVVKKVEVTYEYEWDTSHMDGSGHIIWGGYD